MVRGTAIRALVGLLVLVAAPSMAMALTPEEAARKVAETYGVEVLRVREVEEDGRRLYLLTVMLPGGDRNDAFQVGTLTVDADTAGGEGAGAHRRPPEGANIREALTGTRPDMWWQINPESRHPWASPLAGAALLAAMVWADPGVASSDDDPLVQHGGPAKAVALAADGRLAVTAGFDYSLVVWDLRGPEATRRLLGHDAPLNDVALSPDGRVAVSASDDRTVGVWDPASGRLRARLRGHEAKVASVALSADGRRVASAGWDGTVRLWDLATGREIRRWSEPALRFTTVAFAGDGAFLAAGDHTGALRLWRLEDGVPLWYRKGNGFPLTRLTGSGERLVTGSIDGTIRGRALADGRELFRFEGQEKPVLSLAASPDGGRLASGTAAGTIYLWNIADGRAERVLRSARGPVWGLAFASDGATLYSVHNDGALRVWEVATGRQLAGPKEVYLTATDRLSGHDRGAKLFRTCSKCHSVTPDDENKSGPTFYGLIGRRAGSVPGYPYSRALAESGIVWTEETLARLFELGPENYLPGTRMPFQRMPNAEDRAELVAYIARVTRPRDDRNQTGNRP